MASERSLVTGGHGFVGSHLAAGLLATQLVGEPITPNLVFGLVAVFAGIWIATTVPQPRTA